MTTQHPHAELDRFPQLVRDLDSAFGGDGLMEVVERFIAAERAEFYWAGRIAERNLGAYESLDEEEEAFERVSILGYFHSRYYVATCVVDAARQVHGMLCVQQFDGVETAEAAFAAGD